MFLYYNIMQKKRETVHGVLRTPFFAPTESETRRSNFEHKTSLVSCKKSARRCMVSCGHRFLHRPSRRRDDRTSSTGLCSFHAKRDILSDIPLHEKSARRGSNPSYFQHFSCNIKPFLLFVPSFLHHFGHLRNTVFQ